MKKNFSVAIAGGGSTYTPDMLEMLCLVREDFPLRKVVLYDIDAEIRRSQRTWFVILGQIDKGQACGGREQQTEIPFLGFER